MTKRILVTGGAGFVGSHLVERLAREGNAVTVIDDLSTGSRENLAGVGVELLEWDVLDLANYARPVDEVYHLACPASPVAYQRDPVRTLRTAIEGTRQALELAVKHGARMLLTSTSEVYGDPEVFPQHESYRGSVSCYGPRACYDEGKRAGEALCWAYEKSRGARVAIARLFNTYGPRMALDDGRLVSNLVAQALRGEPMTVYGDGTQTRSLCYVDDTVEGIVRLMERGISRGPVNIGNPDEKTVSLIAEYVRSVCASKSEIVHRDLPYDDPRRRCPWTAKAEKILSWRARTGISEGLARTAEWFRGRI